MVCPSCEAEAVVAGEVCLRCGEPMRVAPGADAAEVIEGSAERGPISVELPQPAENEAVVSTSAGVAAGGTSAGQITSLVPMRPSLPALLWHQPAVRTVAQIGAGTVALTMGLRLLQAWLARPRPTRGLVSSALPTLAELIQQGCRSSQGQCRPGERGVEVAETFVYMQRVVWRR